MRILILAPHPDDDLIGCGGSIIKHIAAGSTIDIVYLTSGDAGSAALGRTREMEATQACAQLGIKPQSLHFLRQKDNALVAEPRLVNRLTDLIRTLKPQILYLPHANDAHADHQATYFLGIKAIMQATTAIWVTKHAAWHTPTIVAYEVWTPIQTPNYFEDTTSVLKKQLQALSFHASQLNVVEYDDMVKGLAKYRGLLLGKRRYAEAFEVLSLESSVLTKREAHALSI